MLQKKDVYDFVTTGEDQFVFGVISEDDYFLGGTTYDRGVSLIEVMDADNNAGTYYNIAGLFGITGKIFLVEDKVMIKNIFQRQSKPTPHKHGFNRIWLYGKSDKNVIIDGKKYSLYDMYEYVKFTACPSELVNISLELHKGQWGGKTRKRHYRKKQTRKR